MPFLDIFPNTGAFVNLETTKQETRPHKNVLNELATKKNFPLPTYQFTKERDDHCPIFTATIEIKINRVSYTVGPGNNKEASKNAAYETIPSIHARDCNFFSQIEFQNENKQNNEFKQLNEDYKVTKSVSKMLADNCTSNNW